MPPVPPALRRQYARLAAYHRAAAYDGHEVTQAARDTFRATFAQKVRDRFPDLTDETEIARRAEALRRAHYVDLSIKRWRQRPEDHV